MEENESRPPLGGLIILFVGAAFITVGVVFLTYGLYSLVRSGTWPDYPFSKMMGEIGFPYPQLGWESGQRALDWLYASSACAVGAASMLTSRSTTFTLGGTRRRSAAACSSETWRGLGS